MFREFTIFNEPVLSFDMDKEIFYVLRSRSITKISKTAGNVIAATDFFKKKGLSRSLIVDDKFLYCKDFCTFYIIDKDSLNCIDAIELGEDLTSDICGITFDEDKIYACIRNGPIAVIDKNRKSKVKFYNVSESSIWDIQYYKELLYAGNVEGHLLVIDKKTFQVTHTIKSHKQNLKSIVINDEKIITASQDKSIVIRDLNTLETICSKKYTHKKMFGIVGVWGKYLITVSFPCGEMKFWDYETLTSVKIIDIPRALSGNVVIDGDMLYLSSRKIDGIMYMDLNSMDI